MTHKLTVFSILCLLIYCLGFFLVLGLGYRALIALLSFILTNEWAITEREIIRTIYFGLIAGFVVWIGIIVNKALKKSF